MAHVKMTLLDAGHCVHPEHVIHQNWKFSNLRFPSMFGLIEHPTEGVILYDTGYSQHFHDETRTFPNRFYALVTPVTLSPDQVAVAQLERRGIKASDVRYVICSHFHADHVSALADFPQATYLFFASAWQDVKHLSGIRGLLKAFLPGLIPHDFEQRAKPVDDFNLAPLPPECAPFDRGFDLFSDGSMLLVPLPGHACGQLGLFVRAESSQYFFVADACWTTQSYQQRLMPHRITGILFESYSNYRNTLHKIGDISQQRADLTIIPSHCETLQAELSASQRPVP